MSRFIDADALKKSYGMADKCSDCVTNSRDCQFNFTFTKMDFCGWIDDAPTADVVEVVRCKDCKWYGIDELKKDGSLDRRYKPSVCYLYREHHEESWYCADAERREDV